MEQQVWSIQLARQSTLRPRVAVLPPHSAFQGHAAHVMQWRITLNPKDSWDTYISQGVDTFLPTTFTAHSFYETKRLPAIIFLTHAGNRCITPSLIERQQ